MGDIRYFEDVKDVLTRNLNSLEFEKELWEKVEIIGLKEEGGAQLDEVTFKNANLSGLEDSRPVLTVSGYNPKSERDEEYSLWFFWKDDDDLMVCDAVGAYSFISSRIINLDTSITYKRKEVEICEDVIDAFCHDLNVAFSNLKDNCESIRMGGPCSLEYMLVDVLKNRGTDFLIKSEKNDYDNDIF